MTAVGHRQLLHLSDCIDRANGRIGRAVAWAMLAMALVQVAIIVARPLGFSSLWLRESLLYFHVALVLFAAAWTLRNDGHVRVDIFYADARPRTQAWIDLIGALALLIPFMLAILWFCGPYVFRSWAVQEGSREAGGMQLVFLLKSAILLFALQMLLQGVSHAIRAALALSGTDRPQEAAAK
jgi:TRAP-type mannitol/chloroaromatic compound transport system permease small subunit